MGGWSFSSVPKITCPGVSRVRVQNVVLLLLRPHWLEVPLLHLHTWAWRSEDSLVEGPPLPAQSSLRAPLPPLQHSEHAPPPLSWHHDPPLLCAAGDTEAPQQAPAEPSGGPALQGKEGALFLGHGPLHPLPPSSPPLSWLQIKSFSIPGGSACLWGPSEGAGAGRDVGAGVGPPSVWWEGPQVHAWAGLGR